MTKSRDWTRPRSSIAQRYQDNDYGYVMHAGMLFVEFLSASRLSVTDLRGKKILDYGCGTGRVARFLSLTGAYVVGYDPTPECITEGLVFESQKAPPTSLTPKLLTSDFSQVDKNFDIVLCINVLGHLPKEAQDQAIDNMVNSLKEGGQCYLWVHKHTHLPLKDQEIIRNQKTNAVIVKGIKQNGRINYYER